MPAPPERIVESQLDDQIKLLEELLDGDVLTFVGDLEYGADVAFRDFLENGDPAERKEKLVVILQTTGGYIAVVQRIAETLRHHYSRVEFIVPDHAMSAGTVLVMSGDAIHMDYFSVLGPIDPQVRSAEGRQVPALGYLHQYRRLIDKASDGDLNTAEITFLVQKFDPAELYRYEQENELSISLLKEWLVKYKFRDWTKTETRGKRVTARLRQRRAEAIARRLSDTDYWHSHGRGISMEVLRRDLKLRIEDFGKNADLKHALGHYCRLLRIYMVRVRQQAVLHRRGSYVPLASG